jgi:type III secretory pathway component EscT
VLALVPFAILDLVMGKMSEYLRPLSDLLGGTLRAVLIGSVLGTVSATVFWFVGIAGTDVTR